MNELKNPYPSEAEGRYRLQNLRNWHENGNQTRPGRNWGVLLLHVRVPVVYYQAKVRDIPGTSRTRRPAGSVIDGICEGGRALRALQSTIRLSRIGDHDALAFASDVVNSPQFPNKGDNACGDVRRELITCKGIPLSISCGILAYIRERSA